MAGTPYVDKEACISCGLCVSTCPGVFCFDEDGKAEVHDPVGGSEADIQAAIEGCPVQCITLKE